MPKNSQAKTSAAPRLPWRERLTIFREEAAAIVSVDVQTIDRAIAAKKLRASKLGRRVLVRVSDIERMLDAQAVHS
jgi:excisionase family DNA binding protein